MLAVVFDLDGTLIDSAPDIAAMLNRVLAADGHAPLSLAEVRGMIGDGARNLLMRALQARGAEFAERHLAAFIAGYEANPVDQTVPYPGIMAALQTLHDAGHVLGVCTNKPIAPTRRILDLLGMSRFFSGVTGGDSTAYRKPDPRHLAATLAQMGVAEAIMVGDHANDLNAAAGLNLPAIFVRWGYGTAETLYSVDSALDLPPLIAQIG